MMRSVHLILVSVLTVAGCSSSSNVSTSTAGATTGGATTSSTSTTGSGTTGGNATTTTTTTGTSTGGTGGDCASDLCGGACCNLFETCVAGACCANAEVCGSQCCLPIQSCVKDSSGNGVCARRCYGLTGDCPAEAPCCALSYLVDGGLRELGGCMPLSTVSPNICRCYNPGDCAFISATDSCAPTFNSQGVISGPYLCASPGSSPGGGCPAVGSVCGTDLPCAQDSYDNDFCSPSCTSDTGCGNPGVACCNTSCDAGSGMCCGLCGT